MLTSNSRRKQHTSVEGVLAKLLRQLHEIALGKLQLVLETSVLGVLVRTADLVLVVVETDDVYVRKPCDLTRRSTDTAADIQHAHARLELHLRSEVVLVPRERRNERLALVEA